MPGSFSLFDLLERSLQLENSSFHASVGEKIEKKKQTKRQEPFFLSWFFLFIAFHFQDDPSIEVTLLPFSTGKWEQHVVPWQSDCLVPLCSGSCSKHTPLLWAEGRKELGLQVCPALRTDSYRCICTTLQWGTHCHDQSDHMDQATQSSINRAPLIYIAEDKEDNINGCFLYSWKLGQLVQVYNQRPPCPCSLWIWACT